jgi:hypothetical protein
MKVILVEHEEDDDGLKVIRFDIMVYVGLYTIPCMLMCHETMPISS